MTVAETRMGRDRYTEFMTLPSPRHWRFVRPAQSEGHGQENGVLINAPLCTKPRVPQSFENQVRIQPMALRNLRHRDTRHQRLPEFHFFCFEHGLRVDIKR